MKLKQWAEDEAESIRDDARHAGRARRAQDDDEYDRLSVNGR